MASADISSFAEASQPIAGEDPCGPNLEYDAQFAALERAAVGKPEQQIGTTIVKAEDPDWPLVEREARRLGLPVLTPTTLRTPEAAAAFKAHRWSADAISLRLWDDAAKDPRGPVLAMDDLIAAYERVMTG